MDREVRITAYERRGLTDFWLQFAGAIGVNYRVERSSDLIQWQNLGNATASAGQPGVYEFRDTDASAGRHFYRAIAP